MRIAVCGGKGGCGKTTTALGFAGALVAARRAPVVLDCDRDMPNLHVYAGSRDEPGMDDVASGTPLASVTHDAVRPEGVRVVPSLPGADVTGALEQIDAEPASHRQRRPPPLVLDTPAGASEDVAVALRFADSALLVTTASRPCIRATAKTASMARALDAPILGVVVSRADTVPAELSTAVGVPDDRIVTVPNVDDPLASDARRPVGRLCGVTGPNA